MSSTLGEQRSSHYRTANSAAWGLGRYFTLLPLSAGQTTDVNERLADGSLPPVLVASRRRIELRMRRPSN
ncbi:hypothetical protein RAD15_24375 [Bradyrhizobium sp. 14AA]